jgi:hypothetical protein
MKITFFNTDSSKGILSLLKTIKKNVGNKQLQFFWYYPSDNYDLRAEAEDFMGDVDMHFTLVPYDFE